MNKNAKDKKFRGKKLISTLEFKLLSHRYENISLFHPKYLHENFEVFQKFEMGVIESNL